MRPPYREDLRSKLPPAREILESILASAIRAVHAGDAVGRALSVDAEGRLAISGRAVESDSQLVVVAAGKAASAMASALEAVAPQRIRCGLVVTKDEHGASFERLALREAAHPVPDARGEAAAREVLELVSSARKQDVLLVLLSGGASALLSCPLGTLTREELAATSASLLACGADIDEINQVRKHVSAVGGGRLARAAACHRIEVLVVSDVPGDRLEVIGSGPCEVDPSTFGDALRVLSRYGLCDQVPAAVLLHLEAGTRGELLESAKPGERGFPQVHSTIVARSSDAAHAAAQAAARKGLRGIWLGDVLSGEARDKGSELARLGRRLRVRQPTCLIATGETTVTLRGGGRGGRSQELALAAALELDGCQDVAVLAAGTDGSDGPTGAAGAFADGQTRRRGAARGRDAAADLAQNDSHAFFSREGGLLRTGPTDTNVMDLVLIGVRIGRR